MHSGGGARRELETGGDRAVLNAGRGLEHRFEILNVAQHRTDLLRHRRSTVERETNQLSIGFLRKKLAIDQAARTRIRTAPRRTGALMRRRQLPHATQTPNPTERFARRQRKFEYFSRSVRHSRRRARDAGMPRPVRGRRGAIVSVIRPDGCGPDGHRNGQTPGASGSGLPGSTGNADATASFRRSDSA